MWPASKNNINDKQTKKIELENANIYWDGNFLIYKYGENKT